MGLTHYIATPLLGLHVYKYTLLKESIFISSTLVTHQHDLERSVFRLF
jgi:hypothetical protein